MGKMLFHILEKKLRCDFFVYRLIDLTSITIEDKRYSPVFWTNHCTTQPHDMCRLILSRQKPTICEVILQSAYNKLAQLVAFENKHITVWCRIYEPSRDVKIRGHFSSGATPRWSDNFSLLDQQEMRLYFEGEFSAHSMCTETAFSVVSLFHIVDAHLLHLLYMWTIV